MLKVFSYLEHDEVLEMMNKADIYIQNSFFETFGLAVIEAIVQGCDLLISRGVGAISVFEEFPEQFTIQDVNSIGEIAEKIRAIIIHPNCERCRAMLKRKELVPKSVADSIKQILMKQN